MIMYQKLKINVTFAFHIEKKVKSSDQTGKLPDFCQQILENNWLNSNIH